MENNFNLKKFFYLLIALLTFFLVAPPSFCQVIGQVEGSKGMTEQDTSLFDALQLSDSLLSVKPDSAFSFTLQSILHAKNNQNTQAEAYGRYQLGKCYFQVGNYELASDSFTEAITVFRAMGDRNGEGLVLKSLGYLLYNIENKEGAIDYYFQSLELLPYIKNPKDHIELYNRLGVAFAASKNSDSSKYFFDKALLLGEYQNDSIEIARTLNNIGFSKNLLNNPKEALNYLRESLFIKQKSKAGDASVCPTLYNMAEAFVKLEQPDSAIQYALQSLEIANRLQLMIRQKESNGLIKDLYFKKGDFENAFIHQEAHYVASQKILNQNNNLLIRSLIERHKMEAEEKRESYGDRLMSGQTHEPQIMGVILAFFVSSVIILWSIGKRRPGLFDFAYMLTLFVLIEWLALLAKDVLASYGLLELSSSVMAFLLVAVLVALVQNPLRGYLSRNE